MKKSISKKIISTFVLVVVLALSMSLFACTPQTSLTESVVGETEEDIYAFSAASTGAMLAQFATVAEAGTAEDEATDELSTDQLDEINDYLAVAESFVSSNPISIAEAVSDREEYETMMIITITYIDGTESTYTMYYNEILVAEDTDETEVIVEDDGIELSDEAAVIESKIDGVMVIGDIEYLVRGEKVIDGENFKISFVAKKDHDNYVRVRQEIENGEEKFVYKVVVDGVVVSESELKFERDGEQMRLRMRIRDGEEYREFSFKKDVEDNESCIQIERTENEQTQTMKVFMETDGTTGAQQYRYRYSSGEEKLQQRNHFGNGSNNGTNDEAGKD